MKDTLNVNSPLLPKIFYLLENSLVFVEDIKEFDKLQNYLKKIFLVSHDKKEKETYG